ncbi:MAG: hypothetical protein RL095_4056 [Verrucomicrobiota bacterium]|jgi:hypothetical protein
MRIRPTSITVVGIIIIAFSVLALLGQLFLVVMMQNPEFQKLLQAELQAQNAAMPGTGLLIYGFVAIFISIACGWAILLGKNWARLGYVLIQVVGTVITLMTTPNKLSVLPSLLIAIVISFFLFRAEANRFFSGLEEDEEVNA